LNVEKSGKEENGLTGFSELLNVVKRVLKIDSVQDEQE
jgi:hypothetical protein